MQVTDAIIHIITLWNMEDYDALFLKGFDNNIVSLYLCEYTRRSEKGISKPHIRKLKNQKLT